MGNDIYYQQYGKKYKNINQTYNGYSYDSKLEANYAHTLDLMMKAQDERQRVAEWDRQFKIDIRVGTEKKYEDRKHICNYFVDFWVKYADGSLKLVEVKGLETAIWRLKVKLMFATYMKEHPELEYEVVK